MKIGGVPNMTLIGSAGISVALGQRKHTDRISAHGIGCWLRGKMYIALCLTS